MKKITLNIPDEKLDFFIQLFKELGLEVVEVKEVATKSKEK